MPSTAYEVYVFDYDGTLVDSASLKRQAFFDIFPNSCGDIVERVLNDDPDASRYIIIPRIVEMAKAQGLMQNANPDLFIENYATQALQAVSHAPIMQYVDRLFAWFKQYPCYIASVTPQDSLEELVAKRGWHSYFQDVFGYPHKKSDILRNLLLKHKITPDRLLMVGDGAGDRNAAIENNCHFHWINNPTDLLNIPGME